MSTSRFTFSQPYRIMIDVRVKARDGVELSTDVYLPAEGGPFPTLLVRTIYDNQSDHNMELCKRFLQAGYAVVMQDCRGRFDSYGEFDPLLPGAGGRLRHTGVDRRPAVVRRQHRNVRQPPTSATRSR